MLNMDFMTYKEYCRKVYEYDEKKLKTIRESDCNKDKEYMRYIENFLVEKDEKEGTD